MTARSKRAELKIVRRDLQRPRGSPEIRGWWGGVSTPAVVGPRE